MASNVTKPPILDGTGQQIKSKLTEILQALQSASQNVPESPLFIDSDGYISMDYDLVRRES